MHQGSCRWHWVSGPGFRSSWLRFTVTLPRCGSRNGKRSQREEKPERVEAMDASEFGEIRLSCAGAERQTGN